MQERLQRALETIQDGIALLDLAAQELPARQRHLFLQGVRQLEGRYRDLADLFEPVDA